MNTLWIVLPAYNEENNIPSLLKRWDAACAHIKNPTQLILIDDGSNDQTLTVARSLNLQHTKLLTLSHKNNCGLAQTLRDGITEALRQGNHDDLLVTMDADNSHPPELIASMIGMLDAESDIVIASRYARGGEEVGVPMFRRMLSFLARCVLTVRFHIPNVRDYTCGFRLYRLEKLKQLDYQTSGKLFNAKGFSCMAEILIRLHRLNAHCREIPLILRYDKKCGKSKMKIFPTLLEYFRLFLI